MVKLSSLYYVWMERNKWRMGKKEIIKQRKENKRENKVGYSFMEERFFFFFFF